MKAALIGQFGGTDVFSFKEVATPDPQPGYVVVKVLACGINRYDLLLRRGAITKDIRFPHVMGADAVGEIVALGHEVGGFAVGQRVIVAPGFPVDPADWDFHPENQAPSYAVGGTRLWGGYAQYVHAPARWVLPDETGLPPEHTAALPLVTVTAIHAVKTLGQVGPGQSVLVQSGASGSGVVCIEMAKALGARVATTVGSPEKIETARRAGADLIINYRADDFAPKVREWTGGAGVEVVIDSVGGGVFGGNLAALRRGGILVNFGGIGGVSAELNFFELIFGQYQIKGSMMGTLAELREGLQMVRDGKIKPIIDRTYPLSQARQAHEHLEQRRVRGKVILLPWED